MFYKSIRLISDKLDVSLIFSPHHEAVLEFQLFKNILDDGLMLLKLSLFYFSIEFIVWGINN